MEAQLCPLENGLCTYVIQGRRIGIGLKLKLSEIVGKEDERWDKKDQFKDILLDFVPKIAAEIRNHIGGGAVVFSCFLTLICSKSVILQCHFFGRKQKFSLNQWQMQKKKGIQFQAFKNMFWDNFLWKRIQSTI